MMSSPTRILTGIPFLAAVALSAATLPADLQVDLLFPRNDTTYAPTQWFPVVFGVKNLDAVWPLDISLGVTVIDHEFRRNGGGPDWQYQQGSLTFTEALKSTAPGEFFFHMPAFNMTNGTTGSYTVLWDLRFHYRCFDNSTDTKAGDASTDGWSNSPNGYRSRSIEFHTAPGAQLPDIEATVNSCPDPDPETSTAVRVTKVDETPWQYPAEPCPWLETDLAPAKCAFQPVAKEVTANVSAAVLSRMGCEDGSWQEMTTPCAKRSMAPPRPGNLLSLGCVLAFPSALFHLL